MLKKLRYKFIIVTSSLVLAVILAIFMGLLITTHTGQKVRAYVSLEKYAEGVTDDISGVTDPKYAVIILDERFSEYYAENSVFDNNDYRLALVNEIMETGNENGRIGDIYYYKYEKNGETVIILGNFARERNIAKQTVTNTLIYVAGGCVLMIIVTYLLSFWVIKPVEQTLDEQKRFIADAGHELKTPLAIIKTNMDVLKTEVGKSEWLENIESQTNRMSELIGELIDLSKAEEKKGNAVKTEFNVLQLLKTTVLQFEVLAYENEKTIDIVASDDFKVKGSEKDFSKVVSVLMTNAVKYATPKTAIVVKAQANQKKISFYNEGCDVDTKDKDKLFERFYRFDSSRARSTGGSGLGLSIAQALCVANGWKIDAECQKDAYIVFTISF